MKLKIYQINSDRDTHRVKFIASDLLPIFTGSPKIDPSIYDEVFDGEVDCDNLEEVLIKFTAEGHPLHRGHSLSVSDVVATEEGAFYCEPDGFKKIDFDESRTQKPGNLLKTIYVEPGRKPFVSEISNDFRAMQKAVDGLIQPVYMDDGTILVCNDVGRLNGMEGNRRLGETIIAGPFFMVGEDGEDFRSLTDAEISKYMEHFAEPEQISQEEVQADTGMTIFLW